MFFAHNPGKGRKGSFYLEDKAVTFSFSGQEDTAGSLAGGLAVRPPFLDERLVAWPMSPLQLPCTGTADAHASPSSSFSRRQQGRHGGCGIQTEGTRKSPR